MNSLNVSENIQNSKNMIQTLKNQIKEIEKEIFRMEGSLRVFEQMHENGIDIIQIKNKKFDIENTEVLDTVDNKCYLT